MTFPLRLPVPLHLSAKAHADYLGISLNALICLAVREYMQNQGVPRVPDDLPAPPGGFRKPAVDVPPKVVRNRKPIIPKSIEVPKPVKGGIAWPRKK
jgi:hypothetical protein